MVVPGRKLLLESELFKQCRKAPKPYTFFLLSDAIVYAVAAGSESRLKFHQILRFRQNRVRVTDAFSTDPQRPFAFKVISTLKSFVVYAPNVDVKNHWIAAVRDALTKIDATDPLLSSRDALEPVPGTDASPVSTPRDSASAAANADDPESAISPRLRARRSMAEQAAAAATQVDSAPVWIADAESNECLLCHAAFTFTKRRHHCRKCGKLVCAKCSSRTLDLGPELGRKARACELCYNQVHASGQVVERSALVLESLGSNLLEFVLSFLSTRDLTAAARVSKRWNAMVARDSLWLASYRRLLLRGDLDLDAPVAARGAELELLRLSDSLDAAPAVGHTPRSRRGVPNRADDEALAAAAAARPVTIVALSLGGHVAPLPAGVPAGDLKRCFVELLRSTRKWRLADSHRPRLRVLRGHTAAVTVLAINPVAGRLFSGSLDCDIKQWDVFRAEPMAHDSQLLCAHANPVTALAGDWSTGGASLSAASNVAAAAAAAAAAVDDDDPSTLRSEGSVRVLRLYSGDKKGMVVCWEVGARRGKVTVRQKLSQLHDGAVRAIAIAGGGLTAASLTGSDAAFNSDGGDVRTSSRADRLLITVGDDGALRFSIRRKAGSAGEYEPLHTVAKAHDGEAVTALHVVVCSRHIITGGADRTVRLWDAVGAFRGADIAQCVPLAVHVAPFEVAALSYRSGALAYAGAYSDAVGYAAVLWEARTGKTPLIPSASLAITESEMTSSNGAVGGTGGGGNGGGGGSRRRNNKKGSTIRRDPSQAVSASAPSDMHVLCLTHDNASRRIAAGMEGDEWAVWTESGAPVCRVNVGRGWVRAVELSGVTMAVGCGDGSLLLYDFSAHARVTLFGYDSFADSRASPQLLFLRGTAQQQVDAHAKQQLPMSPPGSRTSSHSATSTPTGSRVSAHAPSSPAKSSVTSSTDKPEKRPSKPATSTASPAAAATATKSQTSSAATVASGAKTTTAAAAAAADDDDDSSSSIGEIG
jgi:WD40 repeat protein